MPRTHIPSHELHFSKPSPFQSDHVFLFLFYESTLFFTFNACMEDAESEPVCVIIDRREVVDIEYNLGFDSVVPLCGCVGHVRPHFSSQILPPRRRKNRNVGDCQASDHIGQRKNDGFWRRDGFKDKTGKRKRQHYDDQDVSWLQLQGP